MAKDLSCIILAAGKGTRMKSNRPKVMNTLAGWPLIKHVMKSAEGLKPASIITIIADGMDDVATAVAPHKTAIQKKQRGTGDAAKSALPLLKKSKGHVLVILGDVPMATTATLKKLWDAGKKTGLAVLTMHAADPHGYGRIVTKNGVVEKIVEQKDCRGDEADIDLVNAGFFCIDAKHIAKWLGKLKPNNAQREYYLTDIISVAAKDGVKCAYVTASEYELQGINSRAQLAQAEFTMQQILRDDALNNGATLIDPATVYFSADTKIGRDVTIEPNVFFGPGVVIEDNVIIHAFSHLEGVTVENGAHVGPFARVRPKSRIGANAVIGNFVEVNRSNVKANAKSKHMSYLGDATIGSKANIGAGTVIANYDGFDKQDTIIGERVFIGSNSTLVAPMKVGTGAYVAAGSVITGDVPGDALAVARSRTVLRDGWANEYRSKKASSKKGKKK